MGYDALSEKVKSYAEYKEKWEQDLQAFSEEEIKLLEVVSKGEGLDAAIQGALSEAEADFGMERTELEYREEELEEEQAELTDIIVGELDTLQDVKRVLDGTVGKKYTGSMEKASDQCEAYLSQLEDMLEELGESVRKVGDTSFLQQQEAHFSASPEEIPYIHPEESRQSAAANGGEWRRITEPHTPMQDAKATNPNYDPNSAEWSQNCQRCVPAYELRRRGYDVQVKPRPVKTVKHLLFLETKVPTDDDHLSHHPFEAWVPPEAIRCQDGQLSIEEMMREWGDGARAEIMVVWEGGHGSGHVFVAEQINGYTHFIDPQTGSDGVAHYFDRCEKDRIYICRTDDKELSEHIRDCCY